MKVIPDRFISPDADSPEERFDHLGKALFRADPRVLKARLEAEEKKRDDANGGAKPRKPGRPKRKP